MTIEITDLQQENYLDDPDSCPVCGSSDITAEETIHETYDAFRIVRCLHCHHEWEEIFTLTKIQNLTKIQ